ncbi:MAG TPA: peptidylprolyl isomerase [Nitrososphaerales archaeon]|nr:peptidylprolyl isomerase [Nitrososphaerales archaeon]
MSRKGNSTKKKTRTPYALAALVVVVIVAVAGYYVYSSSSASTKSSTSTQLTGGCPAVTQTGGPNLIYACIKTNWGSMEIELFPADAPKTVANFVNLANSGFYNNLIWHRIAPGFVIQTGDPTTRNGEGNRSLWGQGGSSQTVPLEIDPALHNTAGFIGMARSSDPNSGSSQFYINLGPNTNLDGNYTVFGEVISGMPVAYAIAAVPTYGTSSTQYYEQPVNPANAVLISVTILSGA